MLTNSVLPLKSRVVPGSEGMDSWRRVSHGSMRFARDQNMRQPQDGALELPSRVASITSKQQPNLPMEPEDARLTGTTRSLYRRVMGLNVMNTTEPLLPASAPKPVVAVRKPQPRPVAGARTPRAHVA